MEDNPYTRTDHVILKHGISMEHVYPCLADAEIAIYYIRKSSIYHDRCYEISKLKDVDFLISSDYKYI